MPGMSVSQAMPWAAGQSARKSRSNEPPVSARMRRRISWMRGACVSGQRVGFLGPKVSVEKAHGVLLALLPAEGEILFNFHKHNYWHGQQICFFLRPNCPRCPLKGFCDYYQEHYSAVTAEALAATPSKWDPAAWGKLPH